MKVVWAFMGLLVILICWAIYGSANSAYTAPAAAATPADQPSPAPAPGSEWEVTRTANALDKSSFATLSYGGIVIRCAPKGDGFITPVLNNLGHNLDTDSDYEQVVRYRIDDGPIRSARWSIASSFDALFPPRQVLRQLATAKKLTLEYKPEYTIPQTQTFDVSGLGAAEAHVGCKL
jgi:hypothetical protein